MMISHLSKGLVTAGMAAMAAVTLFTSCGGSTPKEAEPAPVVFTFKPDVTFTASPNPAKAGAGGNGSTKLSFTTKVAYVEIHVDAPNGKLLCRAQGSGTCDADGWVKDGMKFYLQDSTTGKPEDPSSTLGGLAVKVVE